MEEHGGKVANDVILDELKKLSASMGFSGEYRYWVLVCGLFNPETRNIVKFWKENEKVFLTLVQQDGKIGIKHTL